MPKTDEQKTLDAEEARRLVATSEAQGLDLRDDEAWEAGHIPGAVHADPEDLDAGLSQLDEDRLIIVITGDSQRDAEWTKNLRDRGCNATNVEGGMAAWSDEKLPVQPRGDIEFEGPGEKAPGT
jgi:rhodanese-related sulfurtransferase